jgi:hypothetical protein
MKKPIRLTERDLSRIVRRVIKEQEEEGKDTRYSRHKDSIPGFVPSSDDDMSSMGKTYGEIRRQAPKVNAELVRSGQGNETDAAFLNELMMLVGKYNIVGFENLVQKVKDLTSQGFSFNFSTYRN